jgi:hypothetical protein
MARRVSPPRILAVWTATRSDSPGFHSAALALLEYLAAVYDVEVRDNPTHARNLLLQARDVLRR